MKTTICFAFLIYFYILLADGSTTQYNIKTPYKSRGLTKVNLKLKQDLPALVIAEDGKALVPIVSQKVGYYRQVAGYLKKYLDKATGGNFLITDQIPADRRAIFIGDCAVPAVHSLYKKAQKMPDESFIVESVPRGIVLVGKDDFAKNRLVPRKSLDAMDRNQSRGTFFAMIDFLERLVGMRFYFPGIGIHIPDLRQGKVSVPSVAYSDKPVFDFRTLGYGGGEDFKLIKSSGAKDIIEWQSFLRLADVNSKMSWHTDSKWHKVYGKTHPEYFALRKDGSRAVGDRGSYSAYRCYTSEAGFQAHIKAIEDAYQGKPEPLLFNSYRFVPNKRYISWGMADAFRGCHCEKCMKLTDPDCSDGAYTELIASYVLKLARECKKRWPDKVLKFHVYGPIHNILPIIEKNNPGNLLVCPVRIGPKASSAAFLKEQLMRDKTQKYLEQLRQLSVEKPYIWLHYPHRPLTGTPCLAPNYYRDFIAKNQNIISGMLFNGHRSYSYAFSSLVLYIMHKISWNPDIDINACVDEYCTTLFGPAAPIMKNYYMTLIDRWENVKWKNIPDKNCRFDDIVKKASYFKETYPRGIRNKLEQMLLQARAKTSKGTIYYDRMDWLVKGTAPFFETGRHFDLGKRYFLNVFKWTPEKIDGLLKEDWWAQGVQGLVLHRNDNARLDKKTLFGLIRISHDDENLYIGGRIRSADIFLTKGNGKKSARDSDIWAYDSLEIFLSTEQPGLAEAGIAQQSQYHQIIIDPDGSIFDAYKNDSGVNLNFACKVYCPNKDAKDQKKYPNNRMYFEIAIPFSELKCVKPEEGGKWYVNFYWNRKRNGKHLSYSWAGTGRHHDTSRFGELVFSEKKPVRKRK